MLRREKLGFTAIFARLIIKATVSPSGGRPPDLAERRMLPLRGSCREATEGLHLRAREHAPRHAPDLGRADL